MENIKKLQNNLYKALELCNFLDSLHGDSELQDLDTIATFLACGVKEEIYTLEQIKHIPTTVNQIINALNRIPKT